MSLYMYGLSLAILLQAALDSASIALTSYSCDDVSRANLELRGNYGGLPKHTKGGNSSIAAETYLVLHS